MFFCLYMFMFIWSSGHWWSCHINTVYILGTY